MPRRLRLRLLLSMLLLGVATITGPWSPLAASRAALRLAAGEPEAALRGYVQAAAWRLNSADQAALLQAAAQIAAVELRDPAQADALLAQAAAHAPDAAQRADLLAQRASLQGDTLQAAALWLAAHEAAPQHPSAEAWRLAAGQHLLQGGDVVGGMAVLEAAAGEAGASALARQVWGRVLLEQGDVARACAVLVEAGLRVCDGISDSDSGSGSDSGTGEGGLGP